MMSLSANDSGTRTGVKRICLVKLSLVLGILISTLFFTIASGEPPTIKVQYPKKDQKIPAVDSTFIFGQVTPGSYLSVNGLEIPVHEQGGFLAWVDVDPGEFVFILEASKDGDLSTLEWPVSIADRYLSVPTDSIAILSSYQIPSAYQEVTPGDLVEVSFRGTPGSAAYFSIEGVVNDVPMTESCVTYKNAWGNEVFGTGAVEEENDIAGVYTGSVYLPDTAAVDSAHIVFKLRVPVAKIDTMTIDEHVPTLVDSAEQCFIVEDTAEARISVIKHKYPQIVELIDSIQTIRTGPGKGYLTVFQPEGVRFVCDGKYSNYLRLRLAPGQPAWVPDTSVIFLPAGTPVPHSHIKSLRCTDSDEGVQVQAFLDEKLPFQVEQIPERNQFVLRIFQATSDTDWIRYLGSRSYVERVSWNQEQEGVYRLRVDLKGMRVWGWDGYYQGSTLTLDIKRGPDRFRSYEDLRIMIDPGHSKDPGAIGPTGLTEAEANLKIARRLATILLQKGATVFMTRVDDSEVKLHERPKMAVEKDCDIFISIHNNAVPDGVNPYYWNGVSTYFYNPHSKQLADFVQNRLLDKLDLPDHGLYYANFAVTRPTQYLAILVECAFMIMPEQEAALRTEEFQEKCAKAIKEGLEDYLKSLDDD